MKCNRSYSMLNGYIDFLGDNINIYRNYWEKIVRSVYAKFYTPTTNLFLIFFGGITKARNEVLDLLEIKDNSLILETGMGPGDNFPLIARCADNLRIFGIDVQNQMMMQCMRNIRKWNIAASLFRADAEDLPFRNEMFDIVFHLGAFNLFPDKSKALNEMIRVAKPGGRIVIADESEKGQKIFNFLTGRKEAFTSPLDLIPGNMQNIVAKTIWRDYGYVIAFSKPETP